MLTRPTLLLLFRLVMEGAWLTSLIAFCTLFTGGHVSAMPGVVSFGLLTVAFVVSYVMQHLEVSDAKLQLWSVVLAVAIINGTAKLLVTGQLDFWNVTWPFAYLGGGEGSTDQGRQTALTFIFGVVLWWRGTRIAEDIPNFAGILMAFRVGVIFVAFQSILEGITPMREGAAGMVVPFFVGGLSALALSHMERVDRLRSIRTTGYGVFVPAGVISAVAIMGLVIGLLPFGELGKIMGYLARAFDFATYTVFYFILLFLGYIAEILINAGNWLLSFVRLPFRMQNPLADNTLDRLREQNLDPGTPENVYNLVRIVVILVLALIVLFVLARAFRRRRRRAAFEEMELHGAVESDVLGGGLLPAWLQRLWAGLSGSDGGDIPGALAAVIRLYLLLLQWAARAGFPRAASRTPFEFQLELERAVGQREGTIDRLTKAFTAVRYGQELPPPEEVRQLEQDLRALRGSDIPSSSTPGVS